MKPTLSFLILAALLTLFMSGKALAVSETDGTITQAIGESLLSDPSVAPENLLPLNDMHNADAYPHEGDHTEHKKTTGLPQLDPKSYPSQLFWLLVSFVVLYTIFKAKVLPDLGSTIDLRRMNIETDIAAAQAFKDQAATAQSSYEDALLQARTQATTLFHTAENAIKEKAAHDLEAFKTKSALTLDKAETAVQNSKMAALDHMQITAAELASSAAEKIIGVPADIDQAKIVIKNMSKKAA